MFDVAHALSFSGSNDRLHSRVWSGARERKRNHLLPAWPAGPIDILDRAAERGVSACGVIYAGEIAAPCSALQLIGRVGQRAGPRGLSLMTMYNPPHPGEFISEIYLEPNGLSGCDLAESLGVAASTVSRILKGSGRITPEMALRLSESLGRSPESWLAMQDAHDLWLARQHVDLRGIARLEFAEG